MNNLYTVNTLNANDQVVIWQGENSNFAAIPQAEFLQGVKDQIDFTMLENQIGDVRNDVNDLTDRVDLISTHNELDGRSAADAHPIEAISGLQEALGNKVSLSAEDQTIAGTKSFNVLTAVDGSGIKKINASNIDSGTISTDRITSSSKTAKGVIRIATSAESIALADGTVALSPSTLKESLNAAGSAPIYVARAWVNWDGATGAIRASGNIKSVVRNRLGNYTITFETAMRTDYYAPQTTMSSWIAGANFGVQAMSFTSITLQATYGGNGVVGDFDPNFCSLVIFC